MTVTWNEFTTVRLPGAGIKGFKHKFHRIPCSRICTENYSSSASHTARIILNQRVHYRFWTARQMSFSWARQPQATPYYPISLRSILIFVHPNLVLPSGLIRSCWSTTTLHEFISSPNVPHAPPISPSLISLPVTAFPRKHKKTPTVKLPFWRLYHLQHWPICSFVLCCVLLWMQLIGGMIHFLRVVWACCRITENVAGRSRRTEKVKDVERHVAKPKPRPFTSADRSLRRVVILQWWYLPGCDTTLILTVAKHFLQPQTTRWFKYDRDWFVCKQAALRSSCATLREWSHNLHPPSCSG